MVSPYCGGVGRRKPGVTANKYCGSIKCLGRARAVTMLRNVPRGARFVFLFIVHVSSYLHIMPAEEGDFSMLFNSLLSLKCIYFRFSLI